MSGREQSRLFPFLPGIDWLPDETVFSLATRHHLLSGRTHPRSTAIQLFGGPRSGFPHDLPSGIEHFARVYQNKLGTADSIIRGHTLLPFFLPFRSLGDTQRALSAMRGDRIGALKSRLGMPASRFGAICPLKACGACMEADRNAHGVAYWHLVHQIPGMWLCPQHGTSLQFSARVASGAERFKWRLPHIGDMEDGCSCVGSDQGTESENALSHLMQCLLEIIRLSPDCIFSADRLLATYHAALRDRNLLSQGGRLRLAAIGADYYDAMRSLRVIPEMAGVASDPDLASSQAARLLREPRTGRHTLWHVTIILWLFGTWRRFQQAYDRLELPAPLRHDNQSDLHPASVISTRNGRRNKLIALLSEPDISVSHAAFLVGVEVDTAQAWAAQAGITSPKRPKRIHTQLRKKLIALLATGTAKAQVAKLAGVSLSSTNRVLRTEIGLHDRWEQARSERTCQAKRNRWSHALASVRTLGVSAARMLDPKAYAWLYRNDRAWLKMANDSITPPVRGNNSHVNWDARDQELARRVEMAWLQLSEANPAMRITIAQICRSVRELKPKLRRLEGLPRTARILHRATQSRRRKLDQTSRDA